MALKICNTTLRRCSLSRWRRENVHCSWSILRNLHQNQQKDKLTKMKTRSTPNYEKEENEIELEARLLRTQHSSRILGKGNPTGSSHGQSSAPNVDGLLYEHHTPTTPIQKMLLTAGSAFMSLYDPYRHDMVAVLGETTGSVALPRLHRLMKEDPVGRQILEERPRINSDTVDMKYLASLPDDTFGKLYHDFMKKNKISADTRDPVRFVDDPDLAYVLQRYREVHDFYHTLLDMPTNFMGEVVIKWFEVIQTRLPMCALGAIFGPVRLSASDRRDLIQYYIPEVFKMAPQSKLLLNIYFERHWETSIDELRDEMRIHPLRK